MKTSLDKSYWQSRYHSDQTGWDVGSPTPALGDYIAQLLERDKEKEILIPGCGRAWEADLLLEKGFTHVTLLDVTDEPLEAARKRFIEKGFEQPTVLVGDFFSLAGKFDLVLEQTFFCALEPQLRNAYVDKMHQILNPGGKLAGVFFSVHFPFEGPPFGTMPHDLSKFFVKKFEIKAFAPCFNSIKPRMGNEHFLIAEKHI